MSIETVDSSSFVLPQTDRLSPVVLSGTVRLIEGAVTALTGLAVFYLTLGPTEHLFPGYTLMIAVAVAIQAVVFGGARLYDNSALLRVTHYVGRIFLAWVTVFAALIVLAFLTKSGESFSHVWLAGWWLAGFLSILFFRAVLSLVVRRWMRVGKLERRVVIVGGGERAEKLIDALEASRETDIRICGVFDDRVGRAPSHVRGYPYLGSVASLVDFARRQRVDMLIVSLPITAENRILQMLKKLFVLPIDIRLAAHDNALCFVPRAYSYVGDVPTLEVSNRPIADWSHVLKIAEDKILSALFLLLGMPIFAVIAIAIKLDSKGPVFFKQKRFGFNNELIEIYKFRTLRHDMTDHTAERLVTADDPRVTKVGKLLRRTSLDELPQLITVLKGKMSIVGPRPHATAAKAGELLYQDVVDGYYARHRVKPGITGWAQISGWRGETDTEEKILRRTQFDLNYIDNWSIWFDLYIILKTPLALLKGENAY